MIVHIRKDNEVAYLIRDEVKVIGENPGQVFIVMPLPENRTLMWEMTLEDAWWLRGVLHDAYAESKELLERGPMESDL